MVSYKTGKNFNLLLIITTFLWAGFVGAISFMEAPVKFQAPSVTLAIGVDVGRLVFNALNKVEMVFCLIMMISVLVLKEDLKIKVPAALITVVLAIESFWLLPVLDERAVLIIAGKSTSGGLEHVAYILADSIKVISLLSLGVIKLNRVIVFQK